MPSEQRTSIPPLLASEIEAVIVELDSYGLRRAAQRLRLALGDHPDERPFPVMDKGRQVRAIPWGLAEMLYPAYGSGQSLDDLAHRGGFGRGELGSLAADCYSASDRPRLKRMPLLDLYDAARGSRS